MVQTVKIKLDLSLFFFIISLLNRIYNIHKQPAQFQGNIHCGVVVVVCSDNEIQDQLFTIMIFL